MKVYGIFNEKGKLTSFKDGGAKVFKAKTDANEVMTCEGGEGDVIKPLLLTDLEGGDIKIAKNS